VTRSANGGSSNKAEANFIKRLFTVLSTQCTAERRTITIGIIAFYNDQVAMLKNQLSEGPAKRWIQSGRVSVQISTVDKFQGSEKDIIVLSCVKSSHNQNGRKGGRCQQPQHGHNIGFLRDFRRVNVALTRAKQSLWVVGNCDYLRTDSLWNNLIADAEQRRLIASPQLLYNYEGCNGSSRIGCNNSRSTGGSPNNGLWGSKRKR